MILSGTLVLTNGCCHSRESRLSSFRKKTRPRLARKHHNPAIIPTHPLYKTARVSPRKCFVQVTCACCPRNSPVQVALRKLHYASASAQVLCASSSAEVYKLLCLRIALCKLLCASAFCKCFVHVLCANALCKLLCARCSAQVLCESCSASCSAQVSVQVRCACALCNLLCASAVCKLLCASCSAQAALCKLLFANALRKLLCANRSAQVALCKRFVQVALCKLLCASALRTLLRASCSAQVLPELREYTSRATFVHKSYNFPAGAAGVSSAYYVCT